MLMVKGDIARFDLTNGEKIVIPDHFGLIHDPSGETMSACVFYIGPYKLKSGGTHNIPKRTVEIATEYFGDDADLHNGCVDLPKGPWKYLGVVKTVYYQRYGKLSGPYYHPYSDSAPDVELYKQRRGKAYKLVLPEGCVVNERGFVWP